MDRHRHMATGSALAALMAAPFVVAPTTSPAAAAVARESLITTAQTEVRFSPNDDGRQDTQPIRFSLKRKAKVSVRVRHEGEVVRGPIRLGRLGSGKHLWRWDGKADDGSVVADGTYQVRLRAKRDGRRATADVSAVVDTVAERGTLVSSRPAVYPTATQVADHVELVYMQPEWTEAWEYFLGEVPRVVLKVRNSSGDVLRKRSVRGEIVPVLHWFARTGSGPVPEGSYVAHVLVYDGAGNRTSYQQEVTVSHEDLVEEVWTETTTAAEAETYRPFFGGCEGCEEFCDPVASDRFADGLSFRPTCSEFFWGAHGYFGTDVPFPEAPVDTYRITATGGPTEPGSSDEGYLSGTPTGPGDSSTTTPWFPVNLTDYPYLPDHNGEGGGLSAPWWFKTYEPASYDVATFTVEYKHYVPVS